MDERQTAFKNAEFLSIWQKYRKKFCWMFRDMIDLQKYCNDTYEYVKMYEN